MTKKSTLKYNDEISKIRAAIRREKLDYIKACEEDVEKLLADSSPSDTGRLKSGWSTSITGKSKLAGNSKSALSQSRPISLKIEISSRARHAPMQMFGWKSKGGQLLTGRKRGGKWDIVQASRAIFTPAVKGKNERKKFNPFSYHSFITGPGTHKPNGDLAWENIAPKIDEIFARNSEKCKYIRYSGHFDTGAIRSRNYVRARIEKWMLGKIDKSSLDSKATKAKVGGKWIEL